MKELIKFLAIILSLSFLFFSCSSQKRLKRAIEKNGIKESVSFAVLQYPEYFKSIHDTVTESVIVHDTIRIESDTIHANLIDSNNILLFSDSLVSIKVDKATNKAKIVIKERYVYRTDTVSVSLPCPDLICPDTESLQSNIKTGSGSGWVWYLVAFLVGLYAKKMIGLVKP
tara:strand:+ start:737 stop:1249 length:513 start_codon:yes stop_codon:yes gene_type:complete